jgi:hypothetical protein
MMLENHTRRRPHPPNLRPSERDCAGLRRTRHTMQRHGTLVELGLNMLTVMP